MKLLFASYPSPTEDTEPAGSPGPSHNPLKGKKDKRPRLDIPAEQVINSAIVGGISLLSAMSADVDIGLRAGGIAFGMTFLFELRKYRKL